MAFEKDKWLGDVLGIFKTGAEVYSTVKTADAIGNGGYRPPTPTDNTSATAAALAAAQAAQAAAEKAANAAANTPKKGDKTVTIILVVVGVLVLGATLFFVLKKK